MEVGEEGEYIDRFFWFFGHHQNDFCIKMGRDESHLNVSVGSDGQSHKTVSRNHNPVFDEKGEPKRYPTEVLPLTSLTARPNRLYQNHTGHVNGKVPDTFSFLFFFSFFH